MPIALATDDFDRADNTDIGVNWTSITSANGLQIVSNAVTFNALGDVEEIYNAVTWPDNQYSQVKVTVTGTNALTGFGIVLRHTGTLLTNRTSYRIVVNKAASANVSIAKHINGSITSLASITTTWVDGDTLKAAVSRSTLKVFQQGTQIGNNVYDSSITSGQAGISYSEAITSGTLDDWEGGSEDSASFTINKLRPRVLAPGLAR